MKIKKIKALFISVFSGLLLVTLSLQFLGFFIPSNRLFAKAEVNPDQTSTTNTVTLRVSNWEEYIDLGDWGQDEIIDLESGDIFGQQSLIQDFESWYEETYGIKVKVEYSNFGTNEDLYNMLTLGDTYDLICPSEYMFMKLMMEDSLEPLSEDFFDLSNQYNYYNIGVSPYIKDIFDSHLTGGEAWSKYAAGYMWGVTGFVYNPEFLTEEEASTWLLTTNPDVYRQVTLKNSVRDSYFAGVGAINASRLMSEEFRNDPNYMENLENLMNNTSPEEIARVEDYLQDVVANIYAFETDSGKADMITGKIVANYQWSGDAVYAIDQAAEGDLELAFAVPVESTNLYFDAWVMLKDGIDGDSAKKHAAEAFINFLSRPDNVVRNMYYIGYTSVISAQDDGRIFDYLKLMYEAEETEDTIAYDLSYFFTGDFEKSDEDYTLEVEPDQANRQLLAQYPTYDVMSRAAIMRYFDREEYAAINDMWVNVRCFNIEDMPIWGWTITIIVLAFLIWAVYKKIVAFKNRSKF